MIDFTENRVWRAISDGLMGQGQKPASASGWIGINCPMCVSRGETPDRRFRGGIRTDGPSVAVNCFNCNFKSTFQTGQYLSRSMKMFMANLGVPRREIGLAQLWAEAACRAAQDAGQVIVMPERPTPRYPSATLPAQTKSLEAWAHEDCDDPWYLRAVRYLYEKRGEEIANATTYYWSPSVRRRLIIPCYYQSELVGWIGRALDNNPQRYHSEIPNDYMFNLDVLNAPKREYVLIVEGVFDGLAISALGALGASLSERQIAWITQSGKQPVVVPDRDRAGHRLIQIAIERSWPVAMPNFGRHQWWDAKVKDVADAVRLYGKLYTLQSILATLTWDAGAIRLRSSYSLG